MGSRHVFTRIVFKAGKRIFMRLALQNISIILKILTATFLPSDNLTGYLNQNH
jgi:hypothetical protein